MSSAIEALGMATPIELEKIASGLPKKANGTVQSSYTAMVAVISRLGVCTDTRLGRIMIADGSHMRLFQDTDYVDIAIKLEELGFSGVVMANIKAVVKKCARDKRLDAFKRSAP